MAIRKNVAILTAAERKAYVDAIKALKAAPSRFAPPTMGRYDDYVYVHMQAMLVMTIPDPTRPVANGNWKLTSDMRMPMWAHRCPAFPPWHRELLYQFERDLQAVSGDPTIGIPYWDWSVDQSASGAPWLDDFMGGDGGDGPVKTGPFAGASQWKLNLSEDGLDHLVRGFGKMPGFPRLPLPAEVTACLQEQTFDASTWDDAKRLASFRNQLEGWYVPPGSTVRDGMHNLVHLWVGGNSGTMLPSTSPNDPVFFLHHCNVDRLWSDWQRLNPASARYLPDQPLPTEPGQGLTEPMIFYDKTMSSTPPWSDPPASPSKVLDHHGLGYSYDSETAAPVPASRKGPVPGSESPLGPLPRNVHIKARDRFRLRIEDL